MKRLIGTRPMSTEDGVYIGTLRPGGLVLTFTCQVLDVDISRPPDHIGTDELPHQGGVIPGDPQTKKNGIVRGIPGTKRANDDRVEKGRPASGTQRLQNGLVFGDLISSGGHQRVVTVLKGHREIDNHGKLLASLVTLFYFDVATSSSIERQAAASTGRLLCYDADTSSIHLVAETPLLGPLGPNSRKPFLLRTMVDFNHDFLSASDPSGSEASILEDFSVRSFKLCRDFVYLL
ncbi:hypothetical protein TNCT_357891 [Trichonephila clavata]|uniref:Uncharacterized protein n=1 Tax=Trichonephila clavata TaxID=2740835 RepID=A0A8X6FVS3_TRICU|nr:hypothetical protein TNCT_357891 [Trichonephila clavata]